MQVKEMQVNIQKIEEDINNKILSTRANGMEKRLFTAITKLKDVTPQVEVKCNSEQSADENTEYSLTNKMDFGAIEAAYKEIVLDSVELCTERSGRSGLYVASISVAERAYVHSKPMGSTLLFVILMFFEVSMKVDLGRTVDVRMSNAATKSR